MRLHGTLVAAALIGALGCGSSDSSVGFGHGPGELDRDASSGGTSNGSGGRTSSGGGVGSDGGSSAAGGTGSGANTGSGASAGTSGTGGISTGNGGTSSGGSAGSGAGGVSNGGNSGAGGACQPKTWCRDRDGDGYGNPSESQTACTSPGGEWKASCNDCQDDNDLVHPGADCQDGPYTLADGVTLSFDYDCDGHELECGDFMKASASGCGVVGPLNCGGSGYLPNPNRTAATNQDAYCGSTSYRNCVSVGLPCVAQSVTKPAVVCH